MPSRIILLNVVIVGLVVSPGSNQAVNQTLPATLVFMHSAALHFASKQAPQSMLVTLTLEIT